MNSRRHVRALVVASAVAIAAVSAPASASPLDILGLGSRRAGQAGAGIASVEDASALYYDPAGLVNHADCVREQPPEGDSDESPDPVCADRDRGEVLIGGAVAYSHLTINGVRAPFADAGGAQVAARMRPISRLALGLAFDAAGIGSRAVVRVPEQPQYPYYRDALSRPVLLVGAAVDAGNGTAIGAAVDLGAGVRHPSSIVGATYQATPSLRIGLAYHQRFAIVDDATGARVHYTPHTALAGVAFTTDALIVAVDAGFAHWSAYEGPIATGSPVRVLYSSTGVLRFGIESNAPYGIAFRFGYSIESAAVPKDQDSSNLLDGTKQTATGGIGYGSTRVRVDAHVSVQIVSTRTKSDATDPTMELKSGGEVFGAGLTLTTRM